MLVISAVSSARRSWVRFPTGVCVFSPEPVSSRYSGSPAIRNMYMIRFDLFYFHVMHMSVLKQKILPFPRSLQKASLPWSTTRVFVIIPPEDISISGGHFSKTYILYVLEKESGLWQERQTIKRSSFSIPPLLWFSIEATLNKLLTASPIAAWIERVCSFATSVYSKAEAFDIHVWCFEVPNSNFMTCGCAALKLVCLLS